MTTTPNINTNCAAINWIADVVSYTGSEEIHPDISKGETVIHNWAFTGKLNERMVRDIHAFITEIKRTQKTYGNRIMVNGYEIWFAELPDPRNAWRDAVHVVISRAE